MGTDELVQLGLRSPDPSVAMQATRLLAPLCSSSPQAWLAGLQLALAQRLGSLRAQALRSVPADWPDHLPPALHARLQALLQASTLDTSAPTRHLAVAHLACVGQTPEALCQAALARWPGLPLRQQAAALQLLADLAQPAGHARVRAELSAPAVVLRQSALVAALRLRLLTPVAALAHALHDNARAYRAAWRWGQRSRVLTRTELQALGLVDGDWRAVGGNPRIQALLQQMDPWEDLLGLLQLPMDPALNAPAQTAELHPASLLGRFNGAAPHRNAPDLAQRWVLRHNRNSVAPTARQWADIHSLLAAGRWGAFASSRQTLLFVLDGWS